MKTNATTPDYKGFRFPTEIISHAVWLYFRFSLSFRDVEELLAQRGIVVTYETVRQWCLKFGQVYANELRRRHPRCGDKWHMDEMYLKINGKTHYLWRAVDQNGNVLDILVQSRRNKHAAKRFFRKLRVWAPIRATRDPPWGGTSAAQRIKQSSGKLPPTDTIARKEDAALQIGQTRATLSFSLWPHHWTFPTTKTSFGGRGVPCYFAGPISDLE